MRPLLLHADRDADWRWLALATAKRAATRSNRRSPELDKFDPERALPWNARALIDDLGLEAVFGAMAEDDDDVFEMVRRELLDGGGNDAAAIRYRQEMLTDAIARSDAVGSLHAIAVEAVKEQDRHFLGSLLRAYPDQVLRWAAEMMQAMLASLRRLRWVADMEGEAFVAAGWRRFFDMIRTELTDEYIDHVASQLEQLRFPDGVLMSASVGSALHPASHHLHRAPHAEESWLRRLLRQWFPSFFTRGHGEFGFSIAARDESGVRALREFSNRGTAIAAQALGDAALHLKDFFLMLRAETAFYVGATRLHEKLAATNVGTCMPEPLDAGPSLRFANLREVGLTLRIGEDAVGNDLDADRRSLVAITGANQGGKSTLLRAIGVAQLMAMAGLFVTADSFATTVTPAVLTHYKREEDASLASGKFDEELARMSSIVDHISSGTLVLLNESFASTSEREASEIADETIEGLRNAGARVIFVTHLFEYADRAAGRRDDGAIFLRAERDVTGDRPFRLREGKPLETSFGEDLYRQIFS